MRKLICKDAVKPYEITSVCKEDLLMAGINRKDIAKFDDADMCYLARKMADAYMNVFWIDLKIIVEDILRDKKEENK
jgi:hypothetical protein